MKKVIAICLLLLGVIGCWLEENTNARNANTETIRAKDKSNKSAAASENTLPENDQPAETKDSAPKTLAAAQAQELVARTKLPTTHGYQRTLRDFLGTLGEADFEHGVTDKLSVAEAELTAEEMYRHFVMTKMLQPLVGWKRGTPAVNAPPWLFLLSTIEGPVPPRSRAAGARAQLCRQRG